MSEQLLHAFRDHAEQLVRPPGLDELHDRGIRRRRTRRALVATALVSALAVGALVFESSGRERIAVPPAGTDPERVVREFLAAYRMFDATKAFSYLADEGSTGLGGDGGQGRPLGERRFAFTMTVGYLQAIGYDQVIDHCAVNPTGASSATVSCPFSFSAFGSGELGLGRYQGAWTFSVQGEEIVAARTTGTEDSGFYRYSWEPFRAWLLANHPGDMDVLYEDADRRMPRIDVASNQIWQTRRAEYVAEAWLELPEYFRRTGVEAYTTQLESICKEAHLRLDETLRTRGIPTQEIPEQDLAVYEEEARSVLDQTLVRLRTVGPVPEIVRTIYHARAFPLMQQYVDGAEAPFTRTGLFWVHQIETLPGLADCTFNLRR